jgi:hypothetical protein
MRAYIRKLQLKSEDTRKQLLVASLVVSMSVVSLVWIYGLNDSFGTSKVAEIDTTTKPFTLFKESISNAFQNISASVGSIPSSKSKAEESTEKQIDLIPVERPDIQ